MLVLVFKKYKKWSQVWRHVPIIPALERLRQKYHMFE
jgi:hypothetical protein